MDTSRTPCPICHYRIGPDDAGCPVCSRVSFVYYGHLEDIRGDDVVSATARGWIIKSIGCGPDRLAQAEARKDDRFDFVLE